MFDERAYNREYRRKHREKLNKYLREYYQEHKEGNRLRGIWNGMIQRCKPGHKYHGDKGIAVCEEWLAFENFRNWALNNGYDNVLTIDRIDNGADYCPANCRWVTRTAQQRNTSYNVNLSFNGETHCLSEWAEIIGISKHALYNRIRRGWSAERALSTPANKYIRRQV